MSDSEGLRARKVGSRDIIFRELTVGDVRALMQRPPDEDLLGATLFEEMALADLLSFTSLTAEDIDGMRPSELREVITICKEQNRDFFAMLARRLKPPATP